MDWCAGMPINIVSPRWRAFLIPEKTIALRIVRAKRTLSEARVPFEIPRGEERAEQLASVLEVIYLIFNEGYSATAGVDIYLYDPSLVDRCDGRTLLNKGDLVRVLQIVYPLPITADLPEEIENLLGRHSVVTSKPSTEKRLVSSLAILSSLGAPIVLRKYWRN